MLAAVRASLRISTFLVPISACLTPAMAVAASLSWTGAVNSDWNNAGNWSPALTPGASDSVVIDGGALPAEVLDGGPAAAGDITVGLDNNGALTVLGTLQSSSATLGSHAGSTGVFDLTGADGDWQNSGTLTVGDLGTGTFTITAGARYEGSGPVYLGASAGGSGSLIVNGASTFTLSGAQPFFIGYDGQGSFELTDAATASTGAATLGFGAGSSSTASISGSGTSWTIDGDLTVGGDGTGTMTVSTGATLSDNNATIGLGNGTGTSSVTISGLGSQWTNSGLFVVGASGNGALSIFSAATVSSDSAMIGRFASGSVTV
ncbi:MAG: hypothetical protein KGI75_29230, partial [Rhizobiaceae bacterium]|nr:hypothetical protein [Rhizobiaceae bacterium]